MYVLKCATLWLPVAGGGPRQAAGAASEGRGKCCWGCASRLGVRQRASHWVPGNSSSPPGPPRRGRRRHIGRPPPWRRRLLPPPRRRNGPGAQPHGHRARQSSASKADLPQTCRFCSLPPPSHPPSLVQAWHAPLPTPHPRAHAAPLPDAEGSPGGAWHRGGPVSHAARRRDAARAAQPARGGRSAGLAPQHVRAEGCAAPGLHAPGKAGRRLRAQPHLGAVRNCLANNSSAKPCWLWVGCSGLH